MIAPRRTLLALLVALAALLAGTSAMAQGSGHAPLPARPHALSPQGGASPSAAASTAPHAAEGVVNINTAGEDELRRLPGIGPARAQAIVALRQRVQRFHAADDLLRVRGIGRAGMRRLRPYVTIAGETTLASRPGRAARGEHPTGESHETSAP